MLKRLQRDWPFAASRSPVFYGWVIWLLSTLGFLMSVPGQTMGMGVFTDSFIEAFGLSRTELSIAYFWGTLGSALLLTRAGRAYDRYGARVMIVASSIMLGLVLLVLANLDRVAFASATWLGISAGWITMPMIFLCYFGVRFAGQGVLTSASRNVLLVWFERRRGIVSGVRGVFVSLGFSIAPLILAFMIAGWGWRNALIIMAVTVGGLFAVLALIFVRDAPQVCGLQVDGGSGPVSAHASAQTGTDQTLAEARRTPEYWAYCLGLAIHALFGTAITFHVVDVFAEAGRSSTEAFGYFLPSAIVSTSVNLLASWLADSRPLKIFLLIMLTAFAVGALGLLFLDQTWGYWLLVLGFGSGGGLWGVLSNLAFIRHHGSLHLGEISGFNTAITVFASAIGPVTFSLARDWTGSYHAAMWVCLFAILALLAVSTRLQAQQQPSHTAL
ncbi:MAG: MFS transporter [Pseudomonadales bacterium]